MGAYTSRNDYFEMICYASKIIAHNRPVSVEDGRLRKCYFRMNDEDEMNAACKDWIYFPAVVHVGFDMRYKDTGEFPGNRINTSNILFLYPAQITGNIIIADSIENAYNMAENAMNAFLSYMQNEFELNGMCADGLIKNLDMNRIRAEKVGPVNNKLFGWQLILEDEQIATELAYDGLYWFDEDPDTEDIIYFTASESTKTVDWNSARKMKFGDFPEIQVWGYYPGQGPQIITIPVSTDAPAPAQTAFYFTLPGIDGFIIFK